MNTNKPDINSQFELVNYFLHDCRSALRTIQGYTVLLSRDTDLKKESIENIQIIRKASENLFHLVEKFQDSYRLKRLIIKTEEVIPSTVIKEVSYSLKHLIDSTNAVIHITEIPSIKSDKELLFRVFQNLIENSLKYNKEGIHPVISIHSRVSENYLHIIYKDNGPGIEESLMVKIFTQKLLPHTKNSGTGLGLYFCKKACLKMRGNIELIPQETGVCFEVTLPIN